MRSATLRKNPMKARIFLATALGIVIAGAALQAHAAPARIAEFGAAPEINLVAQAKISRAKPKVEPITPICSRSRYSGCYGEICPLVGSVDYRIATNKGGVARRSSPREDPTNAS